MFSCQVHLPRMGDRCAYLRDIWDILRLCDSYMCELLELEGSFWIDLTWERNCLVKKPQVLKIAKKRSAPCMEIFQWQHWWTLRVLHQSKKIEKLKGAIRFLLIYLNFFGLCLCPLFLQIVFVFLYNGELIFEQMNFKV